MKVCVISNLYPPYNRGGAERVVASTIAGLKARGFKVVVITAAPRHAGFRADTPRDEDGVTVYRFFPPNIFFYGDDYKYRAMARFVWHILDVANVFSYFIIKKILLREQPDVVHTHNLKGIGYLIPLLIRRLRMRHVHTLHDVQLVTPSGIIMKYHEHDWPNNFILTRLYERLNKLLFGSPAVLISPSKFLMNFYVSRGFFAHSRRHILPNPVDLVNGYPHIFSREAGACRFLYVGQIELHKGVLFLVEAFRALAASDERARAWTLTVVGSGSRAQEIQRALQDCPQIMLRGKAERHELPDMFAAADVTVVPSLCYENSPTVIFESFSFGVPVLASAIEGVSELIVDGHNGRTFTAGNRETLIEGMRWFASHLAVLPQMSTQARASLDGLDRESYLDKLINLCYTDPLLNIA